MKTAKRAAAAAMAALLLIFAPPETALANKQTPVGNLTIDASNTERDGPYELLLSFARPGASPNADAGTGGAAANPRPTGYRVKYRDVSANANGAATYLYRDYTADEVEAMGARPEIPFSEELNPASVYEFWIEPYHTHTNVVGRDENDQPITETVESVIDTDPQFTDTRVLFFTDLEIENVESAGSDITVTWLAPKFANQRVFGQYQLYYTTDEASPMDLGNAAASPIINLLTPSTSSYNITEEPGTSGGNLRYTCTFTANNVTVNRDYTLVVEPVVRGTTWRTMTPTSEGAENPNRELFTSTLRPPDAPNGRYRFQHTPRTKREYRSGAFRSRLALNRVVDEDNSTVRISWDPRFITSSVDRPIYIYEISDEDLPGGGPPGEGVIGRQIGTLGKASDGINYWIAEKPDAKTWYYITLGVPDDGSAGDRKSVAALYDPVGVEFGIYSPKILDTLTPGETAAEIVWDAFIRNIYNSKQEQGSVNVVTDQYGQSKYVDNEVYYEIYVADSAAQLDAGGMTPQIYDEVGIRETGGAQKYPPNSDSFVWSYRTSLFEYWNSSTQLNEPFISNRLYYVKLVARRGAGSTAPVYTSFYLSGDVPTTPQMMARPPLKLGPQSPGQNALYISWQTVWHEAYNAPPAIVSGSAVQAEGWYSKVGVRADGTCVFGEDAEDEAGATVYDLSNESEYAAFVAATKGAVPTRLIDITGSDFEIHVAKFDDVLAFGGSTDPAEAAYQYLYDEAAGLNITPGAWKPFPAEAPYENEIINEASGWPIESNTAYVVFFRPRNAVGTACYPTYVTGVTPGGQGDMNIKPVVPGINIDTSATTDRSITVYWEMSPALEYTLRYGDLLSQYPSGGTTVTFAEISAEGGNGRIETVTTTDANGSPVSKVCYFYKIEGLFALTEYYFWIRSEAPASTNPPSSWSNPVSEVTKDMAAPSPPRELGIASKDRMSEYNAQYAAELEPVAGDYAFLEWRRDLNEDENVTETTSAANGDVQRVEMTALPKSRYLARFGTLVANREYYYRGKTILTMLRQADGIKLQYSYLIQMADNEEFTDAAEIYIPALDPEPPLKRDMVRKESGWTTVYRLRTSPSGGDYDGEWDERLYPLPASDFEITYTSSTGELKYRFRSLGVAGDGTHDNQVDQRFITRMINDRVYVYGLDMTSYSGHSVRKRTLEMPYSIVRAMDERKVKLKLVADNLTLTVAPGSLLTAEVNALADFSAAATSVRYSIEQNPAGAPGRAAGEEYASAPHMLTVAVTTPTRALNLSALNQDMAVAMKLGARYTPYDRNVNTYMTDGNTAGWSMVQNQYDNVAGTMAFATKKVGTYSAISRALPSTADGSAMADSAYTLTTKLNITDMYSYDPGQPINASQFNNIVAAVARGKKSVAVYENMSNEDYQALGRSGILVTGADVPREAGIHALVRLYELKTNATVKNYGTAADTAFADIRDARPEYQASLLKAAKLGFFGGANTDPKGRLTVNDAFEMFAIVIEDAGL